MNENNEKDLSSLNEAEENENTKVAETKENQAGESTEASPRKADSIDESGFNADKEKVKNSPDAVFLPVRYYNDGSRSVDEDIERLRRNYAGKAKKANSLNVVSMIVMILALAGVIITMFLVKDQENLRWVMYTVVGIGFGLIVLTWILSAVFGKKLTKEQNVYLRNYYEASDGFILQDENIEDLSMALSGNYSGRDIVSSHYFSTINDIKSMAVLQGKRDGRGFRSASVDVQIPPISYVAANAKPKDLINLDGTAYVPDESETTEVGTGEVIGKDITLLPLDLAGDAAGQDETAERMKDEKKARKNQASKPTSTEHGLYGKYYALEATVESDKALIICFMGEKESSVLPTYTKGYHAVHIPELRKNIVVYATNILASRDFFDKEGIDILNRFNIDANSVKYGFLSINSYGSYLGLSLSASVMLPPEKPLSHLSCYDNVKANVKVGFDFIDYVNKKSLGK